MKHTAKLLNYKQPLRRLLISLVIALCYDPLCTHVLDRSLNHIS